MSWNSFTLRTKLLVSFGSLAVLLAAVCLAAIGLTHSLDDDLVTVVEKALPITKNSEVAALKSAKALSVAREYRSRRSDDSALPSLRQEVDSLLAGARKGLTEVQDLATSLERSGGEASRQAKAMQDDIKAALASLDTYNKKEHDMMEAHKNGQSDRADQLLNEAEAEMDQVEAAVHRIREHDDQLSASLEASALSQSRSATTMLWGMLVLGTLVAGGLSVFLSGRISGALQTLRDAADRVAGGDTGVQADVDRGDEIGQLAVAFNEMVGQIRRSRAGQKGPRGEAED